ncbi:hypothetical protein BO78DRAFT_141543 [Aspergillus sclerotiicarbonarius CBS 121057]|uniref:Uncharacterized protein n=1 Tax=Aspergillus sclerotiicarbonarius (strain CBS 121057 / IBT 28362) TaxID=1448318 RepID=A0A319ED61_ASPSB|nr:hypothetical protein BO78DRAFT_141543 [Aspergillus sclerotiicarbonarius CBS 121057]
MMIELTRRSLTLLAAPNFTSSGLSRRCFNESDRGITVPDHVPCVRTALVHYLVGSTPTHLVPKPGNLGQGWGGFRCLAWVWGFPVPRGQGEIRRWPWVYNLAGESTNDETRCLLVPSGRRSGEQTKILRGGIWRLPTSHAPQELERIIFRVHWCAEGIFQFFDLLAFSGTF